MPVEREVSVGAARGTDGAFEAYPACENRHEHGILQRTVAPAAIAPETAGRAVEIARTIADALGYVGVLAVEMFVTREAGAETLRVNEIAPRVHNSGHWTSDATSCSQFEQHVRAICGWPLGSTALLAPSVEMENLVGAAVSQWRRLLGERGVALHLYGKAEERPGRKMGHWTRVARQGCDKAEDDARNPDPTA